MSHPNASITRAILRKSRVLLEFSIKSIAFRKSLKLAKAHNNLFPIKLERPFALVLGNGPSLKKLQHKNAQSAQHKEILAVFAINNFLNSQLFKLGLQPDVFVISDPEDLPGVDAFGTWQRLCELDLKFRIAVPAEWYTTVMHFHPHFETAFYFFDDRSLEGFSAGYASNKPRRYSQITAYKSLALACTLQFEKIGLLGIDNTLFKALSVDENNQMWQGSNHAVGAGHKDETISYLYQNGVADYFYFISALFLSLRTNFKGQPITNLDTYSLIDAFPKFDAQLEKLGLIRETK